MRARAGLPSSMPRRRLLLIALTAACLCASCSVKRFAINRLGDSLAESGTTFASDDDPDLVGAALPFSLKLIESLLAESPKHRGLLFAASSGFTQYAYAWVQQEADELEETDLAKAAALKQRARRLYRRARNYGLRGLEAGCPGFAKALESEPKAAVRAARTRDVPLLYWTAASWGSLISLSKDDPEVIAGQPQVEALIDRALELDEAFDRGAIHSFLVAYETSRPGGTKEGAARARKHYGRAMELSGGHLASPLVSLAENVSLPDQNRKEWEELLGRALAVDADARPELRLANLVAQRRARWLLSRTKDLFLE